MSLTRTAQPQFSKPAWLYEPLPFIYIAFGTLALLQLEGGFAALSGSLLILAGAYVLQMRRSYRRAAQKTARKSYRSQQRRK
jgi:hypothetical protein